MSKSEFQAGYVCALPCIVTGHGSDVAIEEALSACGLDTVAKMRKAGVDDYDIKILKPTLKYIRDRKRRKMSYSRIHKRLISTE